MGTQHITFSNEGPGTLCLYAVEDCPTLCRHSATAAVWAVRGSTSQISLWRLNLCHGPCHGFLRDIRSQRLNCRARLRGVSRPCRPFDRPLSNVHFQPWPTISTIQKCSQHSNMFQLFPIFKSKQIADLQVASSRSYSWTTAATSMDGAHQNIWCLAEESTLIEMICG